MLAACFFVEVDILIPSNLTFIPISVKNKDGLACFVNGYIKNIVINHCDYEELKKFGIYCKKIHQGIVYDEYKNTPYKKFVHTVYN